MTLGEYAYVLGVEPKWDAAGVLAVDVHQILARESAGVSRLRTQYAPRQRGRPKRVRDPVRAAEAHGLDIGLLRSNLELTPGERLRQLDALVDFRRRVRRDGV